MNTHDLAISIYDTLKGNKEYTQFSEYENDIEHMNFNEGNISIIDKNGDEYQVIIHKVYATK